MRWLAAFLLFLMASAPSAMAQAPGDAATGKTLALQFCRNCHLVAPEQQGPVPDAIPSFMAIAERPDITASRLKAVLMAPPHPLMPDPPLTQQQMEDVVAYLLSLRP